MFVATGLVYGIEEGYFPRAMSVDDAPRALLLADGKPLKLEIARTPYERRRGLSERAMLPSDTGLWFVFDESDTHGIWMKDMKFPIDIVWVDSLFTIVHIKEGATPESYPEVFTPPIKARYVLEVNKGVVKELGMKVGEKIEYMEFVAEEE